MPPEVLGKRMGPAHDAQKARHCGHFQLRSDQLDELAVGPRRDAGVARAPDKRRNEHRPRRGPPRKEGARKEGPDDRRPRPEDPESALHRAQVLGPCREMDERDGSGGEGAQPLREPGRNPGEDLRRLGSR